MELLIQALDEIDDLVSLLRHVIARHAAAEIEAAGHAARAAGAVIGVGERLSEPGIGRGLVARPEGQSSNSPLGTLAIWNHYLSRLRHSGARVRT